MWCDFTSAGVYHKYDTMVYPNKRESSHWQRLKGYFPFSEPEEFTVPIPDVMQKDCLDFYLLTYQEQLTEGNFPAQYNISQFIRGIQHIYSHMKVQVTFGKDRVLPDEENVGTVKVVSDCI